MAMALIPIDIPIKYIRICQNWHGNADCMLYAIISTGGLTLGTNRPYNYDIHRYLTDEEWHVSLWSSLASDIAYNANIAEKNNSRDAKMLRRFEKFVDDVELILRTKYQLLDSEAV
jgi:hypothetical protein